MFIAMIAAAVVAQPGDLKKDGLYGFPQARATVLCDTPDLRLSAYNDDQYLYLQAIVWKDADPTPGEAADGRKIGDWCSVSIDADADGKATGEVDREYYLDPWPQVPGLQYSVVISENGNNGIHGDSRGHGRITYEDLGGKGGQTVRVDSLLIPLEELGRTAGQPVKFSYWGKSATPSFLVNSVGFTSEKPYYPGHLKRDTWHNLMLAKGNSSIDIQAVPEGRGTIQVKTATEMPKVGTVPPEVAAADWINWKGDKPPSLASLKGKIVVVEFWATWCSPCVGGIPLLNETYDAVKDKGVVVLSLTDQSRAHITEFMEKTPMHYTVGTGSETAEAYGVRAIPQAFIVGRDGLLKWEGNPISKAFDEALEAEAGK